MECSRHVARPSSLQIGPIQVLDARATSSKIFFAVGPDVYGANISSKESESYYTSDEYEDARCHSSHAQSMGDDLSRSKVRRCARLPRGAVVSGMAHSSSVLLVGAGDRLFATRMLDDDRGNVRTSEMMQDVLEPCYSTLPGARVLSIQHHDEGNVFVVCTSSIHSVLIIDGSRLESWLASATTPSPSPSSSSSVMPGVWPICFSGAKLGVVLAAHTLFIEETIRIFAATYSGEVVEWDAPMSHRMGASDDASPCELLAFHSSTLQAHARGCAIFAIDALHLNDYYEANEHADGSVDVLATCSDDRTAAVFMRITSDGPWMHMWRGCGPDFSRSRVFGVAITMMRHNVLMCGTASEDGNVSLYSMDMPQEKIEALASSHAATRKTETCSTSTATCGVMVKSDEGFRAKRVLRHVEQHGGHGALRVGFVGHYDHSLSMPLAVSFVSCGFDGDVVLMPLPRWATEASPYYQRVAVLNGTTSSTEHVRCVQIDDAGRLLCCTEERVVLMTMPFATSPIAISSPTTTTSSCVWAHAIAFMNTSCSAAMMKKARLPTSMASVAVYNDDDVARGERTRTSFSSSSSSFVVLVGTAGGEVVGIHHDNAGLDGSMPRLLTHERGRAYGKCLRVWASWMKGCGAVVVVVHREAVMVYRLQLGTSSNMAKRAMEMELVPLACCVGGPGLDHSCVHLMQPWSDNATVLLGDKHGRLSSFVIAMRADNLATKMMMEETPLSASVQVFSKGTSIAGMYVTTMRSSSTCETHQWLTIVSGDGGMAHMEMDMLRRCVSPPLKVLCSHPLRFSRTISAVVKASASVWVTQTASDVVVYRRTTTTTKPSSSLYGAVSDESSATMWRRVARYANITAPRLLTAHIVPTVDQDENDDDAGQCHGPSCYFMHCSDGKHIDGYGSTPAYLNPRGEMHLSPNEVNVLHDVCLTGKDVNAAAWLPHGNLCAYGHEDGGLSFISAPQLDQRSMVSRAAHQKDELLYGPHHANILAMTFFAPPTTTTKTSSLVDDWRLATVGGLATLTVWQGGEGRPVRVVARRSEEGRRCDDDDDDDEGAHASERMPRYLSVAALHDDGDAITLVVGSSDGTLRTFGFTPHTEELVAYEVLELHTSAPRPITCISVVSGTQLLLAGDTGGSLYLLRHQRQSPSNNNNGTDAMPHVAVLHRLMLEKSAINAISVAHVSSHNSWRMIAAHDSGNAHLVAIDRISHNNNNNNNNDDDDDVWEMAGCACYGGGITAGRGVVWPSMDHPAVVLTEERLALLALAGEDDRNVVIVAEHRVNVRCVSGLAVEAPPNATNNSVGTAAMRITMAGQGIEWLSFDE